MTANAFPEDWTRCVNAGMCSYLPKPFKRETLQAELNKAYLKRERQGERQAKRYDKRRGKRKGKKKKKEKKKKEKFNIV